MQTRIIDRLREIAPGMVFPGGSLREHTTYRVGGPAELLVLPPGPGDLERICRFARAQGIPLTLIGAGSNVIVPDEGIEGIVVCTQARPRIAVEGRIARASAGTMLGDLIGVCASRGLGGLEALAWIPGTVGGALVMNAGTDAGTISDRLETVTLLDRGGAVETVPAPGLRFGYRTSPFARSGAVILSATLSLEPAAESDVLRAVDEARERRARSYPLDLPSAGSVFRRPRGDYAGRLIEEAGCKGMRIGGAAVSDLHANFIVNAGGATASDIVSLIEAVRSRVLGHSGVELELEQIVLPRRPQEEGDRLP